MYSVLLLVSTSRIYVEEANVHRNSVVWVIWVLNVSLGLRVHCTTMQVQWNVSMHTKLETWFWIAVKSPQPNWKRCFLPHRQAYLIAERFLLFVAAILREKKRVDITALSEHYRNVSTYSACGLILKYITWISCEASKSIVIDLVLLLHPFAKPQLRIWTR